MELSAVDFIPQQADEAGLQFQIESQEIGLQKIFIR